MDEAKRDVNKPDDDHEDDGFDDLEGVRGRRGGGTVTKASRGGGSPEAILARYLNTPSHQDNPWLPDERPRSRRRFKKKGIKKARLHDDHHEFRKLPDVGQDQQLARWLYLGYDVLWPLAVDSHGFKNDMLTLLNHKGAKSNRGGWPNSDRSISGISA